MKATKGFKINKKYIKNGILSIFLLLIIGINLAAFLEIPSPIGTVIVPIQAGGGLGNQLFRYAAGYSLAQKTNSKLYIVVKRGKEEEELTHPFQGNLAIAQFRIDPKIFQYKNRLNKAFIYSEKVREYNFFELASKPNYKVLVIDDDFESEIFFKEYKQELLKILTPTKDFIQLKDLFNQLEEKNSVCIHVRRGDMLTSLTHYLLDINYQKEAIKIAKSKLDNPKFYVFSDSIEVVKNELKEEKNLVFIHKSAFEDFILMSHCANNIVANSTFSWWAAYLNDSENHFVIAPYPRYSNKYFSYIKDEQYKKRKQKLFKNNAYPEDWIKVNYESK